MTKQTECQQKELANCNFVKSMLMVLIVFGHSIIFWGGSWFTQNPARPFPVLGIVAEWLNSFHVFGFTLVSGYIFGHIKQETHKYDNYAAFIKKKAKRLIIPYLFIAFVWAIPVHSLFLPHNLAVLFQKYILAASPSQLWFLVMLFDVFCFFWPLSDLFAKKDTAGMLIIAGLFCAGTVCSMLFPNVFMIWTACKHLPLFWLGFKMRQHGTARIRKIPVRVWMIVDLLLFYIVFYIGQTDLFFLKLIRIPMSFLLHIIGAVMIFVVLQK